MNVNGNISNSNNIVITANNILIQNMTVGILKPNLSLNTATSCGAGYNIVNTALFNINSQLQNNVIIGGNTATLVTDINSSTLLGSNILQNNSESILGNVTAVGAFTVCNPGDKTNSTYIGAFAGTDPNNPNTTYHQISNTFIGGNTFAGNDASFQTSIGYGCIKSVAEQNLMYIGTTSETVYIPSKLNIGAVPGSLGALNIDGSGVFTGTGTVSVQDLDLNLNGAVYATGLYSIANVLNSINNYGFILNGLYTGNWTAGDYFGMMGGIQSDASSVVYMPECYCFGAIARSTNAVSGTNTYLSVLKNGIDAGNASNKIEFNTTDLSFNTYETNATGFGLKFNQGDQLSLIYSTTPGGITSTPTGGYVQVIRVTLYCGYSY